MCCAGSARHRRRDGRSMPDFPPHELVWTRDVIAVADFGAPSPLPQNPEFVRHEAAIYDLKQPDLSPKSISTPDHIARDAALTARLDLFAAVRHSVTMAFVSTYEATISWIVGHCGGSDKFAHTYAGLTIWLIGMMLLRRSGTLVPLVIVIVAELANECVDRVAHGSWLWQDTLGDMAATWFWPAMLSAALRFLPRAQFVPAQISPRDCLNAKRPTPTPPPLPPVRRQNPVAPR